MKRLYDNYDNIEVPFKECINCRLFSPCPKSTKWFGNETHYKSISCSNEFICINAILVNAKSSESVENNSFVDVNKTESEEE